MHVNWNHVNQNRGKIKSAELKREVQRGSTFTLTSDLSCIASILFGKVNFSSYKWPYCEGESECPEGEMNSSLEWVWKELRK